MARYPNQKSPTNSDEEAEIIATYYKNSPELIEAISSHPDASMVFESIFLAVKKAVLLIEAGRLEEAFYFYFRVFEGLQSGFWGFLKSHSSTRVGGKGHPTLMRTPAWQGIDVTGEDKVPAESCENRAKC